MNKDENELAAYLKSIPLFKQLDQNTCLLLADSARQSEKKADCILVHEGDAPIDVYVLRQGKGICYLLNPGGKKSVIYHIGVDQAFAVASAIMGTRHSGIIEIVEDATVVSIPHELVVTLMRENAEFSYQIARYVTNYALRLTDLIKDLSFGASARLGRYLFRRALESGIPYGEGVSFDLGLKKGVLADYLGITPETLSRTLTQLQNTNIIKVQGAKIIVNSVRDLVQLSEGIYLEQKNAF